MRTVQEIEGDTMRTVQEIEQEIEGDTMRTVQEIEQAIAAVKDTEARREPERALAKELKRLAEVLENGGHLALSCNRRGTPGWIDTTYVVQLSGVFDRAEIEIRRRSLGSI